MKFIHTGNIHWGMCPDANKSWGKECAQTIKDTFRIIVEKTKKMGMDCLFISGDLFHRQPLTKDPKEVNYLLSTILSVEIILIAGNHDRIRENSALSSLIWSPDVTFIMDEDLTSAYFEDINMKIREFSYHTAEIEAPLLEGIRVPLNSRIQILMTYDGDVAHLLINFNSLELPPSSYIALGHIHKHYVLVDGKIAYYGSPEPLDLIGAGSHDLYAEEIHPVIRKLISLQLILAVNLQHIPLAVNVSKDTTNGELCGQISNEVENRGSQHTYRFRIKGMRDPDIEFDLGQFLVRYRIVEIIDDPESQYDFSALLTRHSSDVIGFYIQTLQKEDMSPVEKKALYYGVNAFLRTADERS